MKARLIVAACGVLGVTGIVSAIGSLTIDTATADACPRVAVFARAINVPPANLNYYAAHDCETVFADRVAVILPPLTGTTKPKQIVVRNIGLETVIVAARQPADRLNPYVASYAPAWPQPPVFAGGDEAIFLHAHETATFTAMPTALPNVWFSR